MTEQQATAANIGIPELTPETVTQFETDGAVVLRGVFNDWQTVLADGIDWAMENPSWRERTYRPDDGKSPFFQDYVTWNTNPYFRDFVTNSPLGGLAAGLMRSHTARMFHEHILVKEPGNSTVTPWHQDGPYYLVEARQSVSFWVPLDPVPRERTIEYVAGSHLWGKSFKPTRFDGTDLYANDDSTGVPDVAANRDQFDILGWAVEPGDAVVFNFGMLHGAPANNSPIRRRVVSWRLVGDDATFVKRPGMTSPAFPDLEYEDGAPFGGDQFPIVYSD